MYSYTHAYIQEPCISANLSRRGSCRERCSGPAVALYICIIIMTEYACNKIKKEFSTNTSLSLADLIVVNKIVRLPAAMVTSHT